MHSYAYEDEEKVSYNAEYLSFLQIIRKNQ